MSNKKQSSIEWLENQLKERYSLMNSEPLFEQAKAMRKEELKSMFECGRNFQLTGEGTFTEVYNETFGGGDDITTKNTEVTMSNILGEDLHGNPLYPGDVVIREGVEETIEFGTYRDKYDCGYVVGYYIPDNCIKVFKGEEDETH